MVATLHSIPVHLSKSQIKSMVMGGAVNITPSMIANDAKHLLEVGTQTAKKIHSHLVKGKGLRVCLKPNEDISEMKSGGKISLKSIGHSISNAFTHPSQTAKTAAHYLIPAATGALGAAAGSTLGGPLGGVAGSALGSYAGHQLDNKLGVGVRKRGRPKKGKGVFKTIKNVFGVNKGDAINMAKSAGKTALKGAAAATGAAIGSYSANPLLGAAASSAIEAMGSRLIDTIDTNTNVQSLGRDASKISRDVALSSAENYIDKNVSNPTEKAMINRALQKDFPSQAELLGAVAPRLSMGRGIRIKKGRGAMMSPDYITAMKYIEGSGISNSTNIKPMTDVRTLSPYASIHSPQMNPFIGSANYQSYNPLENKAIGKKFGGSFLPAG
jgi:hypothetical protein